MRLYPRRDIVLTSRTGGKSRHLSSVGTLPVSPRERVVYAVKRVVELLLHAG